MRIAWFSTVLPNLKKDENIKGSGGWITALSELFIHSDEYTLDIYCLSTESGETYRSGCVTVKIISTKKDYYTFDRKVQDQIDQILRNNYYDLIDIQGLEFSFSKYFQNYTSDYKIIGTIQGFAHQIEKFYLKNINTKNLRKYRTLRNLIFKDDLYSRRNLYHGRGLSELEMLKKLNYVIGRTDWDKSISLSINPEIEYYTVHRILRTSFYNSRKWDLTKCSKHKIFLAQSHYPIKGVDILLKALNSVLKEYPNTEIVITGKNMGKPKNIKEYLSKTDYQNIIIETIQKLNLKSKIKWLGRLNSMEIINEMLSANLVVLPSIIENSPNTIAEAQMLGIPVIANNTGGVPSYVEDGVTGFLYENNSPNDLAKQIKKAFCSEQELQTISINSIKAAEERHNPYKVYNSLLEAYHNIAQI